MLNILIVEPKDEIRQQLADYFADCDDAVQTTTTAQEALPVADSEYFDVVICSIQEDEAAAHGLIDRVQQKSANSIIIVTAPPENVQGVVSAIQEGATDFVHLPIQLPELSIKVEKGIELRRLRNEKQALRGAENLIYNPDNIVGQSPKMMAVFQLVRKVAATDSSVIISGETGTGKELIAGAIHHNSGRAKNAFVRVNCAALPEQLLESELFGHEKGAFTGADKQRIGRFEHADGGTIFLDEVGDMNPATQAKLLRVLQEREIERLGSNKTIKVNVRVLSATNKDLRREVEQGNFREDLYFRLNVVTVNLPPLRQRQEDIPLLAEYFLMKAAGDLKKHVTSIHPNAMRMLVEYAWPGNVRELQNTIERAVILAEDAVVMPYDIYLPFKSERTEPTVEPTLPTTGFHLEEVERQLVVKALEQSEWVQKDAAHLLGVSRRVLNYKIKRFSITHPSWRRNR